MGKSTHFLGQPLYGQVIKLLIRQKFLKSAVKTAENVTLSALMPGHI